MTHAALSAADAAFAIGLAACPRGPDRDGAFALWLVVRAALDGSVAGPNGRRAEHLKALGQRLRSLNPPAPLRRALTAATIDLASTRAGNAAIVLSHLIAPATECLGRPLADAVAAAARATRVAK